MKLRRLRLRVSTTAGIFGTDLEFDGGLVVLRAENSSGKSTVVQSIVFALGLEGMLGPSHAVPLPHAMTDRIRDEETGIEHPVIESTVVLEIENAVGQIATIQRHAKHVSVDTNLVTVWGAGVLSGAPQGLQRDYFVRLPGAAQRERGFHTWLVSFLDFRLPEVPRFNSPPTPLYLETIFPLFFVEQKRGWSGVLARVPTHFQIRDVARRVVEFVLALDLSSRALRRQELEARVIELRELWRDERSQLVDLARGVGGVVQGIPAAPTTTWPPEVQPTVLIPNGTEWKGIEEDRLATAHRIADGEQVPIPSAEADAPALQNELPDLIQDLAERSTFQDALNRELEADRAELVTLERRLFHLMEEQRRLKDAMLLQNLGSTIAEIASGDDCPTCHQHLPEALLAPAQRVDLISIQEAESRASEQIRLVRAIAEDIRSTSAAKELRLGSVNASVGEIQRRIRVVKETLVEPEQSPSVARIEERLTLRRRIEALDAVELGIRDAIEALRPIADEWSATQAELAETKNAELSVDDEQKLALLEKLMVEQLREYGFQSIDPTELTISREKYTPSHEGFDLGFDISASDMIRLIWAYLLGFLEVARDKPTNHLGLLVFDEPRQQAAADVSFAALLRRASTAGQANQQVVFATSEPLAAVQAMLDGVPHSLVNYAGLILRRLN